MKIRISQKAVLEQVAQYTAYTGAKVGDYDKIATVDADKPLLDRFWSRSIDEIARAVHSSLIRVEWLPASATFVLNDTCHPAIACSMSRTLTDCCSESIIAAWLETNGKPTAPQHKAMAATLLNDVCRSLYANCAKRKMGVF